MKVKEFSIKPYNGRLFIAKTKKSYEKAHKTYFNESHSVSCNVEGQFYGGCCKDGFWTYLLWADNDAAMAHELSHAILHIFERVGIDPRESNGEPFCYLLQYLFTEYKEWAKK